MRSSLTRNMAFGFIGAVGFVGSASARPGDVVPQTREGTPPAHVMKADIVLRASHDGRGETNAGDYGAAKRDPAFTTPGRHVDGRLDAPRAFALPIKSDIKNRVAMRDDGQAADDPKVGFVTADAGSHRHGGPSTFREPSRQAPLPIKTDILLKLEGGDESLVNPVARPNDARAKKQSNDQRSKIGDASQAELRDPRKYPGRNENIPTPAQMFSRVSLSHGAGAGDASNEPTP